MIVGEKRSGCLVGVDGCKSGWLVAAFVDGKLNIEILGSMEAIVHKYPEFWGQGYGLELGEAMKVYARDELGAKTLFAGHNPRNERSRRFLPKLGFEFVREEFYEPTGLWHPSYVVKL